MTAETDLLPCPFCGGDAMHSGCDEHGYAVTCTNGECYAYNKAWPPTVDLAITAWNRRANVAHATAARDAEIEALRAERDVYKAADESMQQAHYEALTRAREAEARAERLAEALRECRPFVAYAFDQGIVGADVAGLALDAALEQETTNG